MSKLEELLKRECPDGVECKALSELGNFYAGLNGKNKDDFKDGNAKYITYMNVFSNLSVNTNINDTVQIGEKEKQNIVKYGDVIFTGSSETIEECGMSSVVTNELNEKLYLNSFCFGFRFNEPEIMLPDFSKYLFRSTELRKKIIKTASGVTRFNVSKKKMEKILIPLPPIEVQEEIVRILDTFTKYQDLLNRELELRKKQYEYYRDKLLTFGDEVEYKTVGDVGLVTKLAGFEFTKYVTYSNKGKIIALRGLNVKNGRLNLDEVKYIDESDLTKLTRSKLYIDDMLFTYVGTIGEVALIDENDKYYLAPNVALIRFDKKLILPKFMIYYFQSKIFFNTQINKLLQSSSMKNIPMEKIRKFLVPIPPSRNVSLKYLTNSTRYAMTSLRGFLPRLSFVKSSTSIIGISS